MATLLFKLNNVPEDEAQEVRELLDEQGFHTYETQSGFWGLGVAAIWLIDKEQLDDARAALRNYQTERAQRQDENPQPVPSLAQNFLAHPIRFVAALVAIVIVLGITLIPFWGMMVQALSD